MFKVNKVKILERRHWHKGRKEQWNLKFTYYITFWNEFIKLQCFEFHISDIIPAKCTWYFTVSFWVFLFVFCLFFWSGGGRGSFFVMVLLEEEPSSEFFGVFDYFSLSYEITKYWMVRVCLNVSDIIPANGHDNVLFL